MHQLFCLLHFKNFLKSSIHKWMKYQHFTARLELIFIKSIIIRWNETYHWIVHKTSTLLSSFSFATQNLVLRLLLLNLLWSIRRVQKIYTFYAVKSMKNVMMGCYVVQYIMLYPKKSGLVRCLVYVYIFFWCWTELFKFYLFSFPRYLQTFYKMYPFQLKIFFLGNVMRQSEKITGLLSTIFRLCSIIQMI